MSRIPHKGGGSSLLASNPGIPIRYRCKLGGEWKDLGAFSAAQQRTLQRAIDAGRRIDAAHLGMTCLEHAPSTKNEVKCELCGLYKNIDDYSKNSRRNGDYTCIRCVAWQETQEPDVTPGPLETGHISPEEELAQISRQMTWTIDGLLSDAGSSHPQVPISALSSLGLDEKVYRELLEDENFLDLKSLTGGSASTASTTNNEIPPHLRHKIPSSAASVASAPAQENNVPPHLRAKMASRAASAKDDTASVTSSTDLSLPTTLADSSSETGSAAARSFNAWDANGVQHRLGGRGKSTATSETRSVIEDLQDDPNVVGDWENTTPVFQPADGKSSWQAKDTRLTRTELRAAHGETYQNYISPSIDRQNRYRPIGGDSDSD